MSLSLLPSQFADLEPLATAWSLATQYERERKRAASTPAELYALYNTLLPHMQQVLNYLDQFPLDAMPQEARRLLYLTFSLAEVAPYVECYGGESRVPNSFEETRMVAVYGDRVG